MGREVGHRSATALFDVLSACTGLLIAIVVVLNLHIYAGVDDGYMASPAEVVEHSILLAAVDVLLLLAFPVLAVVLRRRMSRGGPR